MTQTTKILSSLAHLPVHHATKTSKLLTLGRPDIKLAVATDMHGLYLHLAFEGRSGVWFRLGDFPDHPLNAEAKRHYGIRLTSARTDLDSAEAVEAWISRVLVA